MSDQQRISDLYSAYALAIDGGDLAALGGCFAEDAVYEVEGVYIETGVEQILTRVAARRQEGWTHVTSNLHIAGAGSRRDGRATFVVLNGAAQPVVTGEYDDDLVRTEGGQWVFSHRRIRYRGEAPSDRMESES